jgi:hypothetical protein
VKLDSNQVFLGETLICGYFDVHKPESYIYFSMVFSNFVEALGLRVSAPHREPPVKLRHRHREKAAQKGRVKEPGSIAFCIFSLPGRKASRDNP